MDQPQSFEENLLNELGICKIFQEGEKVVISFDTNRKPDSMPRSSNLDPFPKQNFYISLHEGEVWNIESQLKVSNLVKQVLNDLDQSTGGIWILVKIRDLLREDGFIVDCPDFSLRYDYEWGDLYYDEFDKTLSLSTNNDELQSYKGITRDKFNKLREALKTDPSLKNFHRTILLLSN